MTPAEVVALVAAIARAFGLVVDDVLAFARQRAPVLRRAPREDGEATEDARVESALRARGILADWPTPPKADE